MTSPPARRSFLQSLNWTAVLLVALSPSAANGETLGDAIVAAYRNNPTLLEAQLAVQSANEGRWQARAQYLPSVDLSYSVGDGRLERKNGGVTLEDQLNPASLNVRVTQDIYTGGRRGAQMRLSRAGVEGARQGLRLTEQEILLNVVEAYVSVRRESEIVAVREAYVVGLEQQVSGTQRRLDVGEVTRTDLALAEARLAGARAGLASARADLAGAQARYQAVTGLEADVLERPTPSPLAPQTLGEAITRAEAVHPALLQAAQTERAAEARVTIERSALLPQIAMVGSSSRLHETERSSELQRSSSAVAQISLPLFEGGNSWSRLRQSRIDQRRAETLVEEQRRQVVAEVVARWYDREANQEVLVAAARRVAATNTAVAGAIRELGIGLRSTLDVLNTQEEAQEAEIALARAEADAALAGYVLLAATGDLGFAALGVEPIEP